MTLAPITEQDSADVWLSTNSSASQLTCKSDALRRIDVDLAVVEEEMIERLKTLAEVDQRLVDLQCLPAVADPCLDPVAEAEASSEDKGKPGTPKQCEAVADASGPETPKQRREVCAGPEVHQTSPSVAAKSTGFMSARPGCRGVTNTMQSLYQRPILSSRSSVICQRTKDLAEQNASELLRKLGDNLRHPPSLVNGGPVALAASTGSGSTASTVSSVTTANAPTMRCQGHVSSVPYVQSPVPPTTAPASIASSALSACRQEERRHAASPSFVPPPRSCAQPITPRDRPDGQEGCCSSSGSCTSFAGCGSPPRSRASPQIQAMTLSRGHLVTFRSTSAASPTRGISPPPPQLGSTTMPGPRSSRAGSPSPASPRVGTVVKVMEGRRTASGCGACTAPVPSGNPHLLTPPPLTLSQSTASPYSGCLRVNTSSCIRNPCNMRAMTPPVPSPARLRLAPTGTAWLGTSPFGSCRVMPVAGTTKALSSTPRSEESTRPSGAASPPVPSGDLGCSEQSQSGCVTPQGNSLHSPAPSCTSSSSSVIRSGRLSLRMSPRCDIPVSSPQTARQLCGGNPMLASDRQSQLRETRDARDVKRRNQKCAL